MVSISITMTLLTRVPGKFIWEKVKARILSTWHKDILAGCLRAGNACRFCRENLRFYAGDGEAVANSYPLDHVRGFYEGMKAEGEEEILFLCRSAWAGSQRFGAAVWSGDIPSTFASLRAQVKAGLNMSLSGIPWWTHDIGGFRGGDPADAFVPRVDGALVPVWRFLSHFSIAWSSPAQHR